jgi:hypothetical protein
MKAEGRRQKAEGRRQKVVFVTHIPHFMKNRIPTS